MKKIISYCFFLPVKMHKRRSRWDSMWNDLDRYWYNLPALCVMDDIFYPDYVKRFYVTQGVMDHRIGKFFHKIQALKNFEVHVMDKGYEERQLITQRFKPFWEDWDIVLLRDIDSVVTGGEWQCNKVFETSPEAHVYSVRSHRAHRNLMMGGLSGFKPKLIKDKIGDSIEEFLQKNKEGNDSWSWDQDLLNRVFISDKEFSSNRYYDMPIHNAPRHNSIPCKKNVSLREIQSHQLSSEMDMLNHLAGGRWAGQPVDLRGDATKKILRYNNEIKKIMDSSVELQQFYRISLKNNKKTKYQSCFVPKIYRNPTSHKGDTFRELLGMWDESGYCKIIDCESPLTWWGNLDSVLLYEFNNESIAPIPGDTNNKPSNIDLALFANMRPHWGIPWIFWARHPRALEKTIQQAGRLSYEKRDILSIFLGNVITPQQDSKRFNKDWSKSVEVYSLIKSRNYKFSQEDYLDQMGRSKFGLCLAGYGNKCNREPECMGLGVVPIVAAEVDMNYYDSPEEGVHYFRVKHPDEVKQITDNLSEAEWKRMSDNCIDWWHRNCSKEGSFKTTQRIIEENYPS